MKAGCQYHKLKILYISAMIQCYQGKNSVGTWAYFPIITIKTPSPHFSIMKDLGRSLFSRSLVENFMINLPDRCKSSKLFPFGLIAQLVGQGSGRLIKKFSLHVTVRMILKNYDLNLFYFV